MMRIITGSARGTKLLTLEGDATRPTSERAKEAIFSMLQFSLRGKKVLDMFAGSGQMGLEALSRGASLAVLCDMSPAAIEVIKKNAAKTRLEDGCRIIGCDALKLAKYISDERFELVFIDPPYASGLIPQCIRSLMSGGLLECGALLVCESDKNGAFPSDELFASGELELLKSAVYGAARVTIIRYTGGAIE